MKSRSFESRIEPDKTSWVHLFTLPLKNATGRSLTGCCDGDDKDVDDIEVVEDVDDGENVDDDNDVDDIEDADDGDVAIMISQSIVILSFFTREKLDALLRNRKFMQNKVRGK